MDLMKRKASLLAQLRWLDEKQHTEMSERSKKMWAEIPPEIRRQMMSLRRRSIKHKKTLCECGCVMIVIHGEHSYCKYCGKKNNAQ